MTNDLVSQEQGDYLLKVARRTIEEALGLPGTGETDVSRAAEMPHPDWLEAPAAAFVTLHTRSGGLRGCIGSLIARRSLIEDVRSNALAAAFEDPRFPRLSADELPGIVIEVSVLTAPAPLSYADAEELVHKLTPNVDGVVLEQGRHRATFLPQVWDQLPMPEEFLSHLCYKAGLSATAWRDRDLSISTYQVQEFEESTS
ncbi:MAG: AmmeMemoRadiSam system protein A [Anaerolineae bacterium]|nr:AmmeMemoRadiSam system protein A [Anaerolineae bacterium]